MIALVTLLVACLSPWFGLSAVAWVVGVFIGFQIIVGLVARFEQPSGALPTR
jgi:hypothetical protein